MFLVYLGMVFVGLFSLFFYIQDNYKEIKKRKETENKIKKFNDSCKQLGIFLKTPEGKKLLKKIADEKKDEDRHLFNANDISNWR